MKKLLLIVLLPGIVYKYDFAQLKVSKHGGIGPGIEPRTDYKLIIKGDLMLTTYPEVPPPLTKFTEFRFKVGNGWPGCEFGTPSKKIAVWASEVGYNELYAKSYHKICDEKLKVNITSLQSGLSTILQLQSYSYFSRDTLNGPTSNKKEYGLLAQNVLQIIPEIVDTAKEGLLSIDYDQIIPFIVAAFKDIQNIIDSLKAEIEQKRQVFSNFNVQQEINNLIIEINELKKQISLCCDQQRNFNILTNINLSSRSILYQNQPNPYSDKTIIEFEIVEKFKSASIIIFDLQGSIKKIIPILQNGKGKVIINGFELTPGMYLYSLIVDNKEIDTKRMILTE